MKKQLLVCLLVALALTAIAVGSVIAYEEVCLECDSMYGDPICVHNFTTYGYEECYVMASGGCNLIGSCLLN